MAQAPADPVSGTTTTNNNNTSTLPRGKACLRCRKRKMRCDGAKPACAQCVRAHKHDACAYDDGRGKTRTQALRERIARLEEEITRLRDPEYSAPAIVLHDPHALPTENGHGLVNLDHKLGGYFGDSGSSSDSPVGSPSSTGLSVAASPYSSFDSVNSPHSTFAPLRTLSPAVMVPSDEVSPELAQSLLETFLPHRHQLGLALHPERLRASLSLFTSPIPCPSPSNVGSPSRSQSEYSSPGRQPPPRSQFSSPNGVHYTATGCVASQLHQQITASLSTPTARHPVLWNAIFLWACFLSRPAPLAQQEGIFLSRALAALNDALSLSHGAQHPLTHGQRGAGASGVSPARAVIDTVQASTLLARYFFATGALRAAAYHATAAMQLAVGAGMHQVGSMRTAAALAQWTAQFGAGAGAGLPYHLDADLVGGPLRLEPAVDAIEQGERVGVFWQAYVLDRVLSVSMRKPSSVLDDYAVETRVDTPWPEEIEEYENMSVEGIQGDSTLRVFFAHQGQQAPNVPGGFSPLSRLVKAAALYDAASRTAANWGMSTQAHTMDPATLEVTIARFLSTLLPAHQLGAALPDDRQVYLVTHTLAHAALIQLHVRFAREGDPTSLEKCVRAARVCASLVKCISETDYEYLDPIVGVCWTSAASVFALEQQMRAATVGAWSTQLGNDRSQHDLDLIVFAMTQLGTRFPILSFQLSKVFELLGVS